MLPSRNLAIVLLLMICNAASGQVIVRCAGNYTSGYSGDGGPATAAQLNEAGGMYADNAGNVYIADFANNVVRKVNSAGIISTIAGNNTQGYSGDGGPATAAQLYHPTGVAMDGASNLYIADAFNDVVRKINTSGIITTVAGNHSTGYSGNGGPATAARLNDPNGIAADAAGNLYIADAHNNVIRKVDASGIISTIIGNGYNAGTTYGGYAGDGGQATAAELFYPENVKMDNAGNFYVTELYNNTVRKVNTAGIITTIAGNNIPGYSGDGSPATAAKLGYPYDMAITSTGTVYIADTHNNVVRSVDASGTIHTYAGNNIAGGAGDGGPATAAELSSPISVFVDQYDNLYIGDLGNNTIRRVNVPISAVNQPAAPAAQQLAVFPNPTKGTFTVELSSASPAAVRAVITNVVGQTVKEFTITADHPTELTLDAPSGLYFLTVVTPAGRLGTKIILK